MAITIVEKRIAPKDKEWRGSCRNCKSVAECLRSDLKHITFDQREGGEFSWEKCPECGAGDNSGYGGLLMYPKA
jgi:hypothetical protein